MADDHFRERKRCLEILELSPSASEEEIKKAYKAQALKYHPDKNKSPNATEHFQEIQYAYKYLVEGPSVLDHHSDSDDEGIPLFFLMKLFPWLFQSMGSRYERGGGLRPEHFFQMFHDPHDPFGYDDSSDSDEDTYAYRGHPQGGNRPAYTSSRFSSAGASAGTGASASADASSDRRRDSKRQKKRRAKEKHRAEKSAAAAASYTTTSSASSRERSTAASSDGQAESRKKDAPTSQTSLHEDRTTPNENNHDSKKNNEAERSDFGKSTEDELNLSSNADQGQSSKSEEVKPDANTEPTIPHKKTKQRMREEQRKREEEMAKIAKELEEKVRMEKERKARKQAAQEAKERQEAELRRQQEEEEIEKEAKRLALEQKRKDEEAAQKKKEEDDEKERKRLLESFEPDLYMDSTGNFLTRDTTGVGNIKRKPATFNQHPFDPWEQEQENRPSYPPEQSFQYSRGGFRGGRGRGRGYFNQGSGFQPPGSFNMPNRFPAFVRESQSAYKPWADHPQQYVNRSDHFPAFRGQGHVARGGQRAVNPHDVYTAQVQQSGPSNVHANQENHVNGFERCNDNVASRSTGQQDQPERNLSGLSEDGFISQGGGRMGYKHHTHNSFHVSENNDRGFKGRVDDSNSGRKDTFTHSQPGLSCQGERGHVPGMPATFRPTTERSSPGNANNPPLPPKPLSSSGLHISINRPLMQSGANTHPMMQSGMNTRPMMQSGVTTHPMMQSGANTHPMMQRAVSPSPPSPFSVAPPGFTPQAQNYPPPPHLFNPQQVFMPPSLRPPFISLAQPSEFTSRVKISPSTTFSPPPLFQQSTQPPLQQSTQLPLQQSTQPPLQQSAPPPLFQQHTPLSLQQSSQPPLFQQHTPPPLQQSSQPPLFQQHTPPPLQQSTPPPLFQQHTPPPLQQSAPPPLFQQHTPPPLQQSTPPPLFQQHTSPPLQPSTSPPPQQSTPPPLQQSTPPPLLQQSRFSKPFNLPAHLKMNLNIPGLTLQRPTVPPFGGNTSGGTNKPETARTVSPDHGSVRAGGSRNYGLDDIDD